MLMHQNLCLSVYNLWDFDGHFNWCVCVCVCGFSHGFKESLEQNLKQNQRPLQKRRMTIIFTTTCHLTQIWQNQEEWKSLMN
eukprot:m.71023 g.71023  ORF g.71023 m.71023 type:complete len:82 (+) comp35725_c0_seq9:345-590(+)